MKILVAAILAAAVAAQGPADRSSLWPCVWHSFPTQTPSSSYPDGPLIGNGNLGVSIGGTVGQVELLMTTHGFYIFGNGTNSPFPAMTPPTGVGEGNYGFPGCPADNCSIPVGGLVGGVVIAAPALANPKATWTAVQWLNNASVQVTLTDGSGDGSALTVTAFVTATAQLAVASVQWTGAASLQLNVSTWTNGNVVHMPTSVGCTDAATGAPSSSCDTSGDSGLQGHWVRKDSLPTSYFPVSGYLASRLFALPGPGPATFDSVAVTNFTVPQTYWATGKAVPTTTQMVTTVLSLPPGSSVAVVASLAASRDPDVVPADPRDAVTARLSNVSVSALPALWQDHAAWWTTFWSASAIALDPSWNTTEAWYYSQLYVLGSSSRAGHIMFDLWSPFRTSDYPLWRSNPTMDYNTQAAYSGVYATNHVELATPYYDYFVSHSTPNGSEALESAAMGCPGGLHFSVDFAPWGQKLGVWGVPQDWGILSNAAYVVVNYAYHFETTALNTTWIEQYAWPFMTGVARFWQCHLTKTAVPGAPDGYEYWDVNDCTGDEGCSLPAAQRTNPMWGVVYIRRLFATLLAMASATGKTPDPSWADILAHLPPIPTATYAPGGKPSVPVLAWYGQAPTYLNWRGQANNLHAIWPGELLSLSEPNATLLAAGQNSMNYTAWQQGNSFSWVFSAAARMATPPEVYLPQWQQQMARMRPNRIVVYDGLCSDTLGAVQFVVDLLVQGQEGFLRLFPPSFPSNASAAFSNLRMRGAFLVSSATTGNGSEGVTTVTITSEGGNTVTLLSPWAAVQPADVTVCDVTAGDAGGACAQTVQVTWGSVPGAYGGPSLSWPTTAGHTYTVSKQ